MVADDNPGTGRTYVPGRRIGARLQSHWHDLAEFEEFNMALDHIPLAERTGRMLVDGVTIREHDGEPIIVADRE